MGRTKLFGYTKIVIIVTHYVKKAQNGLNLNLKTEFEVGIGQGVVYFELV